MQWDEIHKAMDGYLNEFKAKQLTLTNVLNSKRFTEVDLLNGYQAGCIEGLDNCCDLGLDDLKKIKEGGKKWVKRYTE
jgi:phosphoribulokinase